jgi:Putative restriction endonuclease
MKPAIYARHGIPSYWRTERDPIRVRFHRLGEGDTYEETSSSDERLTVDEPVPRRRRPRRPASALAR